jgi:hypothetical protein
MKVLMLRLNTWGEARMLADELQGWTFCCEYAHKRFVLRTHGTLALITNSIKNVMSILVAKLSVA